jgi:hypothetical protein
MNQAHTLRFYSHKTGFNIMLPSASRSPSYLTDFRFLVKIFHSFLFSFCACYTHSQTHNPRFYHPKTHAFKHEPGFTDFLLSFANYLTPLFRSMGCCLCTWYRFMKEIKSTLQFYQIGYFPFWKNHFRGHRTC